MYIYIYILLYTYIYIYNIYIYIYIFIHICTYIYIILVSIVDKDEEMKQDLPDFNCHVDVISAFTPCGALQMFKAYKQNLQDFYFNMSP